MRQYGAFRPHALDPEQGLGQMAVRRMRLELLAVDDPVRDAVERPERLIRQPDDVDRVAEIPDPEAGRRPEPVILRECDNRNAGDDALVLDITQGEDWPIRSRFLFRNRISETPPQGAGHGR